MLLELFAALITLLVVLLLFTITQPTPVRMLPEGLREFDKPQYCADGACDEGKAEDAAEYKDDTAQFDPEKFIPSPTYTGFRYY